MPDRSSLFLPIFAYAAARLVSLSSSSMSVQFEATSIVSGCSLCAMACDCHVSDGAMLPYTEPSTAVFKTCMCTHIIHSRNNYCTGNYCTEPAYSYCEMCLLNIYHLRLGQCPMCWAGMQASKLKKLYGQQIQTENLKQQAHSLQLHHLFERSWHALSGICFIVISISPCWSIINRFLECPQRILRCLMANQTVLATYRLYHGSAWRSTTSCFAALILSSPTTICRKACSCRLDL